MPGQPALLTSLADDERAAALARLDRSVDRSGGPDACWPWTKGGQGGYGVTHVGSKARGTFRSVKAHRLAYEAATGEAAETVDHQCHDSHECAGGPTCPHRRCCNPAHLVDSTRAENARRAKTGVFLEECRRGHPMRGDNVYESPSGNRHCRACEADRAEGRRAAMRAATTSRTRPAAQRRPHGMTPEQVVDWALDGADLAGCAYWPGRAGQPGYTVVSIGGESVPAHRLVYLVRVGPIPTGHVVDHICHDPAVCRVGDLCPHRGCINPGHLAAVTHAENLSPGRAAHTRPNTCKHGHAFTPENTYRAVDGRRTCRACASARQTKQSADKVARDGDQRKHQDGRCRNGHDLAVVGVDEQNKCRQCDRDRKAAHAARVNEEVAAGARVAEVREGTCAKGHDLGVLGVDARGRCRACARARQAAYKQRRGEEYARAQREWARAKRAG